jgi:hypothetical protein
MKPIIIAIAGGALLLFSLNNKPAKSRKVTQSQSVKLASAKSFFKMAKF